MPCMEVRARGFVPATDGPRCARRAGRYGRRVADPSTSDLVRDAANGDQRAWNQLVERYSRLVWAVARGHRLAHADAADVWQTTWLRLVEHLGGLRNPEQLGGWLSTTARHESLRVLRLGRRERPAESLAPGLDDSAGEPSPESALLAGEERAAVAAAFAKLSERCQALLRLVVAEPALSYADVSRALDIPVGGIGPTRRRCLQQLRGLLDEQTATT